METSGRVVADVEVVANVELPDVALGRLEALSVDECLRLLAANHVGRLAVVVKEQPVVVPVNYALMGRQIVFRSDTGTKLHASAGRRVAFEIDSVDASRHEGWSVLVVGTGHEERDSARLEALRKLEVTPWAEGTKAHWICIKGGSVTGRRIVHEA